jgi:short-subunit dehydrogenase involved in D-alanine esterification of teichoic acids
MIGGHTNKISMEEKMDETANLEEAIMPEPKTLDEAVAAAAAVQSTVTKAFESMGESMLLIAREQEVLREALKRVIVERSQLVDLVMRLSDQVKALTALQDSDHAAVEMLMAIQGTPKERDVN